MIIIFFQLVYFIGKMVYSNYQCGKRKNEVPESCTPALNDLPNKRHKIYDPLEDDYDDTTKAPRFSPPAYIQRYLAVSKVLKDSEYKEKIKKVVDFGCSELAFVVYLKTISSIEEILCVDIDKDTLERFKYKAAPLNADYLKKRPTPLAIDVYEGSVTHQDERLADSDAVIAIELIEHLYPDDLMDFPYNVFGFIKPLVAIITTPNADFNVLFPNLGNDFRHWDHKFEWTREQFQDWANNIVSRYPEYEVSFDGIGSGPPGTEELGSCSQMAIFTRVCMSKPERICGSRDLLKLIVHEEFPVYVDNRSDEEKILGEAIYYIRSFMLNNFESVESLPLNSLMKSLENVEHISVTPEVLREALVNGGWTVVDEGEQAVILLPELSTYSDFDDERDEENELDNDDIEGYDLEDLSSNPPNHDDHYSGTWREDNVEGDYEECWDNNDIPAVLSSLNEVPSNNDFEDIPRVEFSLSRTIDTSDFEGIEVTNVSHVPSFDTPEHFSSLAPTLESSALESSRVSRNSDFSPVSPNDQTSIHFLNPRTTIISTVTPNTSCNGEPVSVCSIFLESSRNDEPDLCPQDDIDSSFDCTELQRSFEDSLQNRSTDANLSAPTFSSSHLSSRIDANRPQSTSSPRIDLDASRRDEHNEYFSKNTPQESSASKKSSNTYNHKEKFIEKEEIMSVPENDHEEDNASKNIVNTATNELAMRFERQKAPANLCLKTTTSPMNEHKTARKSNEEELIEVKKRKAPSPEGVETPPNSWSPEIMDSGYPNSSSMQDTTPEYDLSSIAQDRISDSESPSVEEVPHPGFLERAEVENGDLANNNRDGEGNNYAAVIPENDLDDDLQPLIEVLENDIENENDIYAVENDFPVWLLRILQRRNGRRLNEFRDNPEDVLVAVYAGLPELDEGFDSSSSENESQYENEEDEDGDSNIENAADVSTGSSEETMDSAP